MLKVLGGQQDLGGVTPVPVKFTFVGFHEDALAHGSHGLQLGQVARPLAESEPPQAGTHRPGTDQGHSPSRSHDFAEFVGQLGDPILVEPPIVAGQNPGANLHHDGGSRGRDFLA